MACKHRWIYSSKRTSCVSSALFLWTDSIAIFDCSWLLVYQWLEFTQLIASKHSFIQTFIETFIHSCACRVDYTRSLLTVAWVIRSSASVCVFVRMIEPKWLKLQSPKVATRRVHPEFWLTVYLGLKVKDQRVTKCKNILQVIEWLAGVCTPVSVHHTTISVYVGHALLVTVRY